MLQPQPLQYVPCCPCSTAAPAQLLPSGGFQSTCSPSWLSGCRPSHRCPRCTRSSQSGSDTSSAAALALGISRCISTSACSTHSVTRNRGCTSTSLHRDTQTTQHRALLRGCRCDFPPSLFRASSNMHACKLNSPHTCPHDPHPAAAAAPRLSSAPLLCPAATAEAWLPPVRSHSHQAAAPAGLVAGCW